MEKTEEMVSVPIAETLLDLARAFRDGEVHVPRKIAARGHDGADVAILLAILARSLQEGAKK